MLWPELHRYLNAFMEKNSVKRFFDLSFAVLLMRKLLTYETNVTRHKERPEVSIRNDEIYISKNQINMKKRIYSIIINI